jgi:hypothetical protein
MLIMYCSHIVMHIPMDNSIYLWLRTDPNIGIRTCKPEHKRELEDDYH